MPSIRKVVLQIEGMHCDACVEHVTAALRGLRGVQRVELASWRSPQATVIVSEEVAERELIEAVARAGYRARVLAHGQPAPAHPHPSAATEYDLITIGGGSAAFAAAIRAAELGARVAIVEKGTLGGTCVNVGCVPSKTLIRAAQLHFEATHPAFDGLRASSAKFDWPTLVAEKDALIGRLRQEKYLGVAAAYPNISILSGEARLVDAARVAVDGRIYRSQKILLATGSHPWAPPIEGLREAGYLDSTAALSLRTLPRTLAVLGGGTIGLELAQLFARVGVGVSVFEALPQIAPLEEPEISAALRARLAREGIQIHTGITVTRVERVGGRYRLWIESAQGNPAVEVEQLLVATGRRPTTADLGLESAGVQLGARGEILVNEYLQTANPAIYAAGDCLGEPMFVYVAAHAGALAAQNAFSDRPTPCDLSVVPRVTFTDPQIASVGFTQAAAEAAGFSVRTAVLDLKEVPRAIVNRTPDGLIKLVVERSGGRLLGVHVLAPEAGEIIQEATLAIRYRLRAQDLVDTLHPYLTMAEGLRLAAIALEKDVRRLSCCAA